MKIAYFDCLSGASGDMILGVLLSAGADLSSLQTVQPFDHTHGLLRYSTAYKGHRGRIWGGRPALHYSNTPSGV